MNGGAVYKVSFGRMVRTLVYEDEVGMLFFTFDCSPAEKQSGQKWNLHLDTRALAEAAGKLVPHNANSEVEKKRLATALERVKEYASSCGYVVLLEGKGVRGKGSD
jgi:hypothetical protein